MPIAYRTTSQRSSCRHGWSCYHCGKCDARIRPSRTRRLSGGAGPMGLTTVQALKGLSG
ncbi:hypothetical protein KCP71_19595 [Salmonella enterica subsp. enterica]|nr:hypothetical protein KCP71_19595 [Salmonella enterica subsp. enterica]